jgi:hypothetical protein
MRGTGATSGVSGTSIATISPWDSLRYSRDSFNQDQLDSLVALDELYSVGQRYCDRTDQWIHLDSFPNRAL